MKTDEDAAIPELKAIKRLLSLMLVRDGVPQKTVAKAAGVRLATINQISRGIVRVSRDQNGKVKG